MWKSLDISDMLSRHSREARISEPTEGFSFDDSRALVLHWTAAARCRKGHLHNGPEPNHGRHLDLEFPATGLFPRQLFQIPLQPRLNVLPKVIVGR